jgi:hypothetical protein
VSQREVEARLSRLTGGSPGAQEYVEAETKDLEWYAFDRETGEKIKGTKKELLTRG